MAVILPSSIALFTTLALTSASETANTAFNPSFNPSLLDFILPSLIALYTLFITFKISSVLSVILLSSTPALAAAFWIVSVVNVATSTAELLFSTISLTLFKSISFNTVFGFVVLASFASFINEAIASFTATNAFNLSLFGFSIKSSLALTGSKSLNLL